MTYLLQVSTCWIVFYGIYLLFLRKETFFSINRYYLLGALVTGLLVPYLGAFMPANEASVEVYQVMNQFSAVEVAPQAYVEEAPSMFTWMNLLWAVYILGGLVVFSRFVYGLNRIYSIYIKADITQQGKYTLVESDKYHLPFSFFHFIFISKKLPLNDEVVKVLKHEELHANQWHSIDIVFTEMLQVFFWFNPILIMYKNALRQSHEYLADAYVTQDYNINSYGQLLLQQSTSGLEIALANQFFHSQIKKRITMMYKEKSKRSAMVKYLAAVPVLAAMLIIFSSNQMGEAYSKDELQKAFGETYSEITTLDDNLTTRLSHWGNFLNKHINEENFEQVSKDLESISEEYGIILNVEKKEVGQPYRFGLFMHIISPEELIKLNKDGEGGLKSKIKYDIIVDEDGSFIFNKSDYPTDDVSNFFNAMSEDRNTASIKVHYKAPSSSVADILNCASKSNIKINVETINNIDLALREDLVKNAETLSGLKDILKYQYRGENWDQITILSNGVYMQDQTHLTENEVLQIIEKIKEADANLKIKVVEGAEWQRVDNLLGLAAAREVKTEIIPTDIPTNFDGRKITYRNWKEIVKDLSKVDGRIVINAEANAQGKMTYVEIDSEKTTILDRAILKRVLTAAKGYRIEEGKEIAKGTIILNCRTKGNIRNNHDQHNYGESNGDKSMLDLIEDFTNDDPIFKVVEEMPRFPGCEEIQGSIDEKSKCAQQKMLEFIYSNLKYPKEARESAVEGTCVVQFVVEKDGLVKETKIVRDIGAGCGVETLKVVNSFPTWISGKQKGKAVRVLYTLPVKFKLEGETKKKEVAKIVAMGKANTKAKKENLVIEETPELKEDIFKVVEEMPRFSGCEDMEGTTKQKEECAKGKLLEYIYSNIKYPKEARKNGIDGMSVIQMVIEKDGSVTNVNTLRDPGAGTGPEAARVVREMPIWIPGKQNGKKVRVQYVLPVKFKLEGDDKPLNNEKLPQEKTEKKKYKTSLTYTADQFMKIKDVAHFLRDVGLKEESKAKVLRFSMVKAAGKEAHIAMSIDGKFNSRVLDLMSQAKIADRYFFEEIVLNMDGKEENIGALSIMIVDGLPSLVKSLIVVNEKVVGSDCMNNINPEDIEKMDILKGEKMKKKYGDIPHNSVVEITLKPGKKLTKYLIDGKLFGYDFYRTIDQSHINKERPATEEEVFMRGVKEDLIVVSMHNEYGHNSAYFPGTNTKDDSDQALLGFVGKNISYPKSAIDNNIEGLVTVNYTVEADGELSTFKIDRSLGWGLDKVVIEMMEKLAEDKGAWKAAHLDNRSIATSMVLPVKFKLQSDQKKEAKSRKLNPTKFSVSPNPSNGNFNIVYQLDKNVPANLTFYSSEGKTLKKMLNLPAENRVTVDFSNQGSSIIYITLEQDGKVKTIKATVQN